MSVAGGPPPRFLPFLFILLFIISLVWWVGCQQQFAGLMLGSHHLRISCGRERDGASQKNL